MARSKFARLHVYTFMALAVSMATPALAQSSTSPVTSQAVDTSGLSPEKIKQIQDIVNSGKSTVQTVTEAVSPAALGSYAEVGKAIGSSVAEAAKAIGVAAKDFSDTWMGKVAIFMIVWKLMLGEIVGGAVDILIGIGWMLGLIAIWSRYFKRICLVESTTTEVVDRRLTDAKGDFIKNDAGEYQTEKVTSTIVKNQDIQDGVVAGYRFTMFIILAFASIPGLIFLF